MELIDCGRDSVLGEGWGLDCHAVYLWMTWPLMKWGWGMIHSMDSYKEVIEVD